MTVEVVGTVTCNIVIVIVNIEDSNEITDGIFIVLIFLLFFFMCGAYLSPCMKLCCSGGCSSESVEEEMPLGTISKVRPERRKSLHNIDMWATSNNSRQSKFGTI